MNPIKYIILAAASSAFFPTATIASQFPDPGDWQKRTEYINGGYLLKVSDGIFIANSHYSENGETWKEVKNPSHSFWLNCSGYGSGTFVLTGAAGQIFTSTDFENWTSRNPGGGDVINVTYGNNTFIAARYYSSSIWISKNSGVDWTSITTDAGYTPGDSIHFGSGMFYWLTDNKVLISSDAINWTTHQIANTPNNFNVRNSYFNGEKLIGSQTSSRNGSTATIVTGNSKDGISWSFNECTINSESSTNFYSAGGGVGFHLITSGGSEGEVWITKDDGDNWSKVTGPWTTQKSEAFFAVKDSAIVVATSGGIYSAQIQSNFSVVLSQTTNGNLLGSGTYEPGTPTAITANPNPGYRFTGWTGDASGTKNPLTITMDANKTIGATFEKDLSDVDADGLTAYDELVLTRTNPLLADTDGDGKNDGDSDQDGDGLSNLFELNYQGIFFTLVEGSFTQAQAAADAATRRGRLASFRNANDFNRMAGRARKATQGYLWLGLSDAATEGTWLWSDGNAPAYTRWLNGQPDGGTAENHAVLMEATTQWADAVADFVAAGYLFERVGLDPLASDTDGDGLSDGAETNTHQTNPVLDDSDSDGLTDGAEINTHGSSPKLADTDSDGLSDFAEVVTNGTNPAAKDSDGDGFDDLFEINTGFNPTLDSSTPDAISSIRTAVEFRFNAGNGLRYRIEGSTDLQNWETVETDIIGNGGVVTRFYSIENQPKRYFRVVKVGGSSDPGGDGI